MSEGRTVWWAKDAAWWRREWIVELGEEFGPAGPAVVDWLACEAKAQNDHGFVSAGQRTVARGCFVDLVTVGHILSRAVTLCLLEEFEERDGRFRCRMSGWKADQDKALAANRKAKQRSGQSVNTDDQPPPVTDGHDESRPVPECPPTGQDRTVKTTSSSVAARADRERGKANDEDRSNCRLFADLAQARNPKLKIKSYDEWLRQMRLCREQDDNLGSEIEQLIRWTFTDPSKEANFWADTIQSPAGLRKNFAQIWARMTASGRLHAVPVVESSADYLRRRGAA